MRMRLALASCLLVSSCGIQSFDVDEGAVVDGAAQAVRRWPEVRAIVDRLDVFGLDARELQRSCRVTPASRVEGCAAWPGSVAARARIYVLAGLSADETAAVVEHELQHLRPSVWALPDACASHAPSCWEG